MVKNTCNVKESSSRKYTRNIRKTRKKTALKWGVRRWRKANKLNHRTCSKKARVVTQKNTNQHIIYNPNSTDGEKNDMKGKDVCVICCESAPNLKYINCKRGGLQNVKFGRYGKCCEDKPICLKCRERCREKCPFCNEHKLYNIANRTTRWCKKKKPFVEREKVRMKKMLKKQVKFILLEKPHHPIANVAELLQIGVSLSIL
jgi:hypothetical protein